MKNLLLIIAAAFLGSCGALQKIDQMQFELGEQGLKLRAYGDQLEVALDTNASNEVELVALKKTNEDLVESNADLVETTEALEAEIEEGAWTAGEVGTAVGGGITGAGGLIYALLRAGTAMAASRVNEERDRRRAARGERFDAPPYPPPMT